MTLLSTISNEAINENLKKRFENKEIYVSTSLRARDRGVLDGSEQRASAGRTGEMATRPA